MDFRAEIQREVGNRHLPFQHRGFYVQEEAPEAADTFPGPERMYLGR